MFHSEDIERIEVIRGPGGTVWGANAVNGVISITTKKANQTLGGLVSALAGSQETTDGLVQYGGNLGKSGAYRVFGKYYGAANLKLDDNTPGADGWHVPAHRLSIGHSRVFGKVVTVRGHRQDERRRSPEYRSLQRVAPAADLR